jgi:hypothetical protein
VSTKNNRSRKSFRRLTELSDSSPAKGSYLMNALWHSQSSLASGKFHFSAWINGRYLAGAMGTSNKGYYTKITPSPNASYIQISFIIQPANLPSVLQVNSDNGYQQQILGGYSSNDLLDLREIIFEYPVTGGVEANVFFNVENGYIVKGLTISDSPLSYLSDSETGHCDIADYYSGKPLTVEIIQQTVSCQETIIDNFRKTHVNVATTKDDEPLESVTPLTTWANVFDTSISSYSSSSPGFWIRPGAAYYGNRHVKIKCRVKAVSASGTAIIRFAGNDQQYSDEIAVTATSTPTWYEGYFYCQTPFSYGAEYNEKIDIQCKDSGTMQLDIYNILLEEQDELVTSVDSFRALDTDSMLPSIANLPAEIMINGITVAPTARHWATDATVSAWAKRGYGEDLSIADGGSDPTVGADQPLLGSLDSMLTFSGGKVYQAGNADYCDFGTKDALIEILLKTPTTLGTALNQTYISKRGSSPSLFSFQQQVSASNLVFFVYDGSSRHRVDSSDIITNSYYLAHIPIDVSESTIDNALAMFLNGAMSGVSTGDSIALSTLSNSELFTVGAYSPISNKLTNNGGILGFSIYLRSDWFAGGAQNLTDWAAFAKERFARLCSVYPQIALGTSVPAVYSRSSSASLRKYVNGVTKIHRVGENWPRIEYVKDGSDADFKGYLSEPSAENKCLQSEDMSTTWAKVNAGDTISSNSAAGPDGETSFDGIVSDATDTQHGFSQSITLTADSWTFSKFMKAGDRDWGYLDVSTISNAYAYFDLSARAVGTVGAAATAGIEDYGGGIYRCWISYTGTADAHIHRSLAADSDGDNSIVGDASTTNIYQGYAQVELGSYPTSYIKTTTAAVTRAADRLYYVGDDGNAGDEHGTIECTVLSRNAAPTAVRNLVTLSNAGSPDNKISSRINTSQQSEIYIRDAASDQVSAAGSTDICDDDPHIVRARYKVNSTWGLLDGVQEIAEDGVCTMPTIDRIDIGSDEVGESQAGPDVWVKRIRLKKISTSD